MIDPIAPFTTDEYRRETQRQAEQRQIATECRQPDTTRSFFRRAAAFIIAIIS